MNHVLSNKKLADSTSKRTLNIDHCLMNIKLLHFVFFVLVELLSYCFAKCSFNAAYQFQIKLNQTTHRRPCCQTQPKMVHHFSFYNLKLKENFQYEWMDLMGSDNGNQLCLPHEVLQFTYF